MRTVSASNTSLGFIKLKGEDWLEKQRIAGKVAAGALMLLEGLVKEGSSLTLLEMNAKAEEYICDHGCQCTFKNYKSFPAGVCISVNHQLVHAIPTDYRLQEGDLVSFDLGATYHGAIADTALTTVWGEAKPEYLKLVQATEEALMRGIAAIQVGKRLGAIGHAIYRYSRDNGYGVITNYGGHSLDYDIPHASPFVANKATTDEGPRIQAGITLAIEPMLVIGDTTTWVADDGWTVHCKGMSAHFEHSVFVHEDHVEIITARN